MYESIPNNATNEYLNKIDKIEKMKENLKINTNELQTIMDNDVYESVNLEGNKLTRKEVTMLLENDVTIRGKFFKDYAQASNYKIVLNLFKEWLKSGEFNLSEDLILYVHKLITANELPINESGVYRDDYVFLSTTEFVPPAPELLNECMKELLQRYNETLQEGYTMFEKICEFKRNFERIHPFFDGNGRTGRAIMNLLFLKNGYSYISFPSAERDRYFDSLENNSFHELAATYMLQSLERM